MYFPYLRGKQFELIAMRELVALALNSKKIVPIVDFEKINSLKLTVKFLRQ